MNIVNKMINLAQALDNLNLYNEADTITKIASSINIVKTSNLISPDNLLSTTKQLNNTVKETDKSINDTNNIRTESTDEDSDNKREADGFINTTKMPYDANRIRNEVKNTSTFLNRTQQERNKTAISEKKVAKTINLMGLSNTVKDQQYKMREIAGTLKNVSDQRNQSIPAFAKNNSDEKTGERDEKEDKEAISLTTLPEQAKRTEKMLTNTKRTIENTEQMRK